MPWACVGSGVHPLPPPFQGSQGSTPGPQAHPESSHQPLPVSMSRAELCTVSPRLPLKGIELGPSSLPTPDWILKAVRSAELSTPYLRELQTKSTPPQRLQPNCFGMGPGLDATLDSHQVPLSPTGRDESTRLNFLIPVVSESNHKTMGVIKKPKPFLGVEGKDVAGEGSAFTSGKHTCEPN